MTGNYVPLRATLAGGKRTRSPCRGLPRVGVEDGQPTPGRCFEPGCRSASLPPPATRTGSGLRRGSGGQRQRVGLLGDDPCRGLPGDEPVGPLRGILGPVEVNPVLRRRRARIESEGCRDRSDIHRPERRVDLVPRAEPRQRQCLRGWAPHLDGQPVLPVDHSPADRVRRRGRRVARTRSRSSCAARSGIRGSTSTRSSFSGDPRLAGTTWVVTATASGSGPRAAWPRSGWILGALRCDDRSTLGRGLP